MPLPPEAITWAQANPSDPNSQAILARSWAEQNPNDPKSSVIMQKYGPHPKQFAVERTSMTDNAPDNSAGINLKNVAESAINNAPTLVGMLGGAAAGIPGAMIGGAAGAAARGAIRSYQSGGDQTKLTSSGVIDAADEEAGGAMQAGSQQGLGRILGVIGKAASDKAATAADKIQQAAMGMKKYLPGAGTEAVNQGIRGSKSVMADQMKNAISKEGSTLDGMVSKLNGEVDNEGIANKVADYGRNKFQSANGAASEEGESLMADANDKASEIYNRGTIQPEDARFLAQTAEKTKGFSSQGTPRANYQGELARVESRAYRDSLRQMGDDQGIPVADQFSKLHKMLKGAKALDEPEVISSNNPLIGVGKAALRATVSSPTVQSNTASGLSSLSSGLQTPATQQGIQQAPSLFKSLQRNNQ